MYFLYARAILMYGSFFVRVYLTIKKKRLETDE